MGQAHMCTSPNEGAHSLGKLCSCWNTTCPDHNHSQSKQRVLNGAHGSEVFRARKTSLTTIAPPQLDESFARSSQQDDSVLPEWMRLENSDRAVSSVFSPEILLHSEKLPSVFEPTRKSHNTMKSSAD